MESSSRHWNDLPDDLLELTLLRLPVIDYSSFGRVCRSWNQVLLGKMSQGDLSLGGSWLIAYENNGSHRCYFQDLMNSRECTREFPELQGTICLGSRYGWSLLCSGTSTVFFFNFFSRQRIALPEWKSEELNNLDILLRGYKTGDLAACFSKPPTSTDCVVIIICRIGISRIVISRCMRGGMAWTTRILSTPDKIGELSGALVEKDVIYLFAEHRQSKYYIDNNYNIQTWFFDAVQLSWKNSNHFNIVQSHPYARGEIQKWFSDALSEIIGDRNPKQSYTDKGFGEICFYSKEAMVQSRHTVDQEKEDKEIVAIFMLRTWGLVQSVGKRIPLESWYADVRRRVKRRRRSAYTAGEYIWIDLCPFVLRHPFVREFSSRNPSLPATCLSTYRFICAPVSSKSPKQAATKEGGKLQAFFVEPLDLFQA